MPSRRSFLCVTRILIVPLLKMNGFSVLGFESSSDIGFGSDIVLPVVLNVWRARFLFACVVRIHTAPEISSLPMIGTKARRSVDS